MKRSRMLSDPAGLSHWHQTGRPAAENVLSPAFGLRPLAYTTDTAGYTEIVFALFDLLGLQFSPRIRDLGDQQLYRLGNIPHYRYLDTRLKGGFYLEIRPQRYRCPHCEGRPTTTQRCHWYDPNSPHTQVFEKWVWRCLVNSTVVEVSHQLGLGPDAVDGILGRWVSTTVDWNRLTTLATLGIDEMALRRGPGNYVVVISTRDAPRQVAVLAVLPDRLKATVKGLLEEGAGQSQHVVTPIVLFDPGQTVSAQS